MSRDPEWVVTHSGLIVSHCTSIPKADDVESLPLPSCLEKLRNAEPTLRAGADWLAGALIGGFDGPITTFISRRSKGGGGGLILSTVKLDSIPRHNAFHRIIKDCQVGKYDLRFLGLFFFPFTVRRPFVLFDRFGGKGHSFWRNDGGTIRETNRVQKKKQKKRDKKEIVLHVRKNEWASRPMGSPSNRRGLL